MAKRHRPKRDQFHVMLSKEERRLLEELAGREHISGADMIRQLIYRAVETTR